MFWRRPRLSIDMMFNIPHVGRSTTVEELVHSTRENFQIAFELARGNLSERVDEQKASNSKLSPIKPEFTRRQNVLVYKPHQSADGPIPKLIQPWRRPHIIYSKLLLVVYRIRLPHSRQVPVHMARIKSHKPLQSSPAPDFHKLKNYS